MVIVVENLYYKAPPENPGGVLFVLMSDSMPLPIKTLIVWSVKPLPSGMGFTL